MAESASVLIVDDDPEVRGMIAEYLGGHGYEIAQAGNGDEMRQALARRIPDVVLLDLNLGGEDGLSLARYLREHHDVGIIMVTAASDVVDRIVGLEVGADDYVAKPFDPRELRARLKSVLRRVRGGEGKPSRGGAGHPPRRVRVVAAVSELRLPVQPVESHNEHKPVGVLAFRNGEQALVDAQCRAAPRFVGGDENVDVLAQRGVPQRCFRLRRPLRRLRRSW